MLIINFFITLKIRISITKIEIQDISPSLDTFLGHRNFKLKISSVPTNPESLESFFINI